MLRGLDGSIVCSCRVGGKSLVARVQQEARVPVIGHPWHLSRLYVHDAADLAMARAIVLNAKLRRTGLRCRRDVARRPLVRRHAPRRNRARSLDARCEVRGDAETLAVDRA